jgi:hypothetical protein
MVAEEVAVQVEKVEEVEEVEAVAAEEKVEERMQVEEVEEVVEESVAVQVEKVEEMVAEEEVEEVVEEVVEEAAEERVEEGVEEGVEEEVAMDDSATDETVAAVEVAVDAVAEMAEMLEKVAVEKEVAFAATDNKKVNEPSASSFCSNIMSNGPRRRRVAVEDFNPLSEQWEDNSTDGETYYGDDDGDDEDEDDEGQADEDEEVEIVSEVAVEAAEEVVVEAAEAVMDVAVEVVVDNVLEATAVETVAMEVSSSVPLVIQYKKLPYCMSVIRSDVENNTTEIHPPSRSAAVATPAKESKRSVCEKDERLEWRLNKLNCEPWVVAQLISVVSEWGVTVGHVDRNQNYAAFERHAFDAFRALLEKDGIKFNHSLVRVDGNGTCFNNGIVASAGLPRYFRKSSRNDGKEMITPLQLKTLVSIELHDHPFKMIGEMSYIDTFIYNEDGNYKLAYPDLYANLPPQSKTEVMADYLAMSSKYSREKTFNNELVALVTARMLSVELHQYSDKLLTWVVVNDNTEANLYKIYLMNGSDHFWTWLHNDELPGLGHSKVFTSEETDSFNRMEGPLFEFDEMLSRKLPKVVRAAVRKKTRTIRVLAEAGVREEIENNALRASKRRLYSLFILQWVLRNVGSLLPSHFKDRPVDEQVKEALRAGGDWKKGRAEGRGIGPFTETVFKEAICQEVLSYLISA